MSWFKNKHQDGERVIGDDPSKCQHKNKHYYKTNDGKDHWICRDCSATDLG